MAESRGLGDVYKRQAFIAIFGVISQILSHRNLKKKKEYFEKLHKDLKPGKEVMLTGGIYGKIVSLKEDTAIINVAKDVNIKVSRYSISEIVN